MEENKMGVMPVNKLLISMALPMMISMLVQALYNIVDSMFVAQISENALTAVSLAFPAQNLMIAIGTGTGVGINALVSRSLGERNQERANLIANNGLALYVISGILFAIFGLLGSNLFFRAQTDDPEIVRLGTEYLRICCLLSTAIFLQFGNRQNLLYHADTGLGCHCEYHYGPHFDFRPVRRTKAWGAWCGYRNCVRADLCGISGVLFQ